MSRRRAESVAERLLHEQGISEHPVDVKKIASGCGARIEHETFRESSAVSGVLVRHGSDIVIGVNDRHAFTRQRFTMAHELGHLSLHPGRPVIVEKQFRVNYRDEVSSMATNSQEIEANQFAAALLMPSGWVAEAARHYVEDLRVVDEREIIERLAADFSVSRQSMGYRLINLGILTSLDIDLVADGSRTNRR